MAVLEWSPERIALVEAQVGLTDEEVLHWLHLPDAKVGIDCPFGWPIAVRDFVNAHMEDRLAIARHLPKGWKRELTLRETDRHVHARTGITPLSVSADRIAHAALRWASIVAKANDIDRRRDGAGKIAEVYPAAALSIWNLRHRGYKGRVNFRARGDLVDSLRAALPQLDLGPSEDLCRKSDDVLDAVVCALIAHAVAIDATEPPQEPETALAEGWIHLPTCPIGTLARLPERTPHE